MADVEIDNNPASELAAAVAAYSTYPFGTDEEFQQGLNSLMAGGALVGKTDEEKADVVRLAQIFYFNRKTSNNITVDAVRNYEQAHAVKPPVTPESDSNEPRVLSFAELQELIQSGRVDEIPNNRIIPDTLNEAPPSESKTPAKLKPWEKEASTDV
ncbi:hypothetical protein PC9H_000526 [Pleurotus ostreatus]|uniref:Uncharacterized protein n=2 Tax=Pleurotus ostreatus TaxID=5322 RepID=A0A067NYL2_PLEO1|nr:uncharacterized protein PC9H_000526 [Pleurotus ostreatus]KAF7440182.1 hypothetical protein PC9H_000526 [Pleurotus ostreatus]KAJ8700543.1 hypothetical protein PTI98_003558 [Pleurotus ostreatus]KDQ32989.1 hypothetical protein PLEOSDRAFT_1098974 [Pleurotus ostreatus PC15]